MSCEVKLEVFEGPLDLLLHLIHRNEVGLSDIPIALITAQYLETVELMQFLNLDVAGEYLVMAAYLTQIKSRMLLPSDAETGTDEPQLDPREDLVAHLLEYKRYKEAAHALEVMPILDKDIFVRDASENVPDMKGIRPVFDVSLSDLVEALRELMAKTPRCDLIEIEPEKLLIKNKINEILARVEDSKWITFKSLFQEDLSRINVIVTFLALLETVKLQLVTIYQDTPFGTILISKRSSEHEP